MIKEIVGEEKEMFVEDGLEDFFEGEKETKSLSYLLGKIEEKKKEVGELTQSYLQYDISSLGEKKSEWEDKTLKIKLKW